jgi:hypothetical protein
MKHFTTGTDTERLFGFWDDLSEGIENIESKESLSRPMVHYAKNDPDLKDIDDKAKYDAIREYFQAVKFGCLTCDKSYEHIQPAVECDHT